MNPALIKSMLKNFGFDAEKIEADIRSKVEPQARKTIETIVWQ